MAQLGARLDGIEEVVGSNPIGSTILYLWSLISEIHIFVSAVALVSDGTFGKVP